VQSTHPTVGSSWDEFIRPRDDANGTTLDEMPARR